MALFEGTWLQIHQFDDLGGSRNSLDELIDLAKSFRFAGLLVKAFDGDVFMNQFDSAPDAIGSIAEIGQQKQRCTDAEIGYGVWVNPLHPNDFPGLGKEFLDRQGDLYGEAGEACGLVVFDSEDGNHFWGARRPKGDASRLMEHFRAKAPNCVSVWQPDGRVQFDHLLNLRPEEWGPHMNVYAPQTYWTDFQRPFADVLNEQFHTCQVLVSDGQLPASAEWRPTFPAKSTSHDLIGAMNLAAGQGASGCIMFDMRSMRESNLDIVKQTS